MIRWWVRTHTHTHTELWRSDCVFVLTRSAEINMNFWNRNCFTSPFFLSLNVSSYTHTHAIILRVFFLFTLDILETKRNKWEMTNLSILSSILCTCAEKKCKRVAWIIRITYTELPNCGKKKCSHSCAVTRHAPRDAE